MIDYSAFWFPGLICLYGTLCHGAMLLNDGVYWDGWMIDSWQRNKNWKAMKRFFGEVGLPIYYYQHRLLSRFNARILVYRLIGFASTLLSALAIYLISIHLGYLGEFYSFALALLYLSYAGYHMNIDTNVSVQYTFPASIFYWAAYIAFLAHDQIGASHWGLRVTSLLLFFVAFNANSLLVYYFGFLAIKMLTGATVSIDNWQLLYHDVLNNLDYFILPFVFWILKENLTPRHGFYKDYNRIRIRPVWLVFSLFDAVRSGMEAAIGEPIRSAAASYYLWLPGGMVFAAAGAAGYDALEIPTLSRHVAVVLLISGAALFLLGALPYALVEQKFAPAGWATKNHMLFHLPVSLIVLGGTSLLFPTELNVLVMAFVLAANMVYLNRVYLYYIAVVAKNRSWLLKLSKIDAARRISVFYITDMHSIRDDPYFPQQSPAYSFYMFEWLWGDKTHIGVHVPAAHQQRLHGEEIVDMIARTSFDYDMQQVDIHGAQAKILIRDGIEPTPIIVALRYLKERYRRGGNVQRVLEDVTDLEYIDFDAASAPFRDT